MLIDLFTVAAQIVNFLVLVWLLKRFLYKRILDAVEARESRIAASLAEADAKQKEAGAQLALYTAKLEDFEQQEHEMLAQARAEAARQQAQMLEKARGDVRALEAKWKEDLEHEQSAFLADLQRRAAAEILAITRRILADLAGLDVQECAVRVFLEKIRDIDEDTRKNLAQGELLIRSAFELPHETQDLIREALGELLRTAAPVRFERAPGISLGIELRGNGWRVGWNSESYLEGLEEDLREALQHSEEAKAAGVA